MKYVWNISLVFALFALTFLTACNKDTSTDTATEAELTEYVELALVSVSATASVGAEGCYELVFPVSIEFADGTTSEVGSVEEMKAALRAWKAAHPHAGRDSHPTLVLPVELIATDGSLITVSTQEELRALRAECGDHPRRRPHHGDRECSCFQIIFPLTLQFPDGTTAEVADRMELKMTLRQWKADNPDATERPELVFPINVELEDGTIQSVDSIEALRALKESCAN